MIELAFWREIGISGVSDAAARYQRILDDHSPVPVSELDDQLQTLIQDLHRRLPDVVIVQSDDAYSRHGIVVRLGDQLPEDVYSEVVGLVAPTRLTMYDPEFGLVMGDNDSIDIEIHDSGTQAGA